MHSFQGDSIQNFAYCFSFIAGDDYRLIAEDVISLPTSSVVCITVDIIDNSLSDGDKMFTLQLSTIDQSVDLFSANTSIFIFDDNGTYM